MGNRGSWWNSGWSRDQRVEWKWDMVPLEEGPVKQCGVHAGVALGDMQTKGATARYGGIGVNVASKVEIGLGSIRERVKAKDFATNGAMVVAGRESPG